MIRFINQYRFLESDRNAVQQYLSEYLHFHQTKSTEYSPCFFGGIMLLQYLSLLEPRREKTGFLHMRKTKTQISFAVTAKLISAFVFATRIVQSLYFLNLKFQASSHFLWLYSPVCVGPGRKHRRPVFSQRGPLINCHSFSTVLTTTC